MKGVGFVSAANIDASPLVAFDTSSATALTRVLGIHAWSSTVDSVDDDPPRAFVLASRISDNMANALILGPYCSSILSLGLLVGGQLPPLPSWGLRVARSTVGRA